MVSGGPYGLEDLVHDSGYGRAILILLITPVLWSIPTALMVGELSSALPDEGGYYVWARRALGPFWGFQTAWLSLVASIFDMAIYPTLFVVYLTQFFPALSLGHRGYILGVALVAACALWNMKGAREVGRSSLVIGILLLTPFVLMVIVSIFRSPAGIAAPSASGHSSTLLMGILVALWNFMGWDNASTIAAEVENPQRTYPLAMALTVFAVTAVYVVSVGAAWHAHIDLETFRTGGWAAAAQILGGKWLMVAIVAGGCISTFGTFNSLTMSYSRVPYAMAEDGLLPKLFLKTTKKTGSPWVAILVCAVAWALSLGIGFERLVELDVLLYGGSLLLEFTALAVLRVKEPHLHRPFKVPGGLLGAILLGVAPMLLVGLALVESNRERIAGMNVLLFGLILAGVGVVLFAVARLSGENFGSKAEGAA